MSKQFRFEVSDGDFRVSEGWCGRRKQCVAVAIKTEGVALRDTKSKGTLYFTHDEWQAFLGGAKAGQFDHQS